MAKKRPATEAFPFMLYGKKVEFAIPKGAQRVFSAYIAGDSVPTFERRASLISLLRAAYRQGQKAGEGKAKPKG